MRGEVILGFTFVGLQSSVENGRKVGMRGGCGGPGAEIHVRAGPPGPGWCKRGGFVGGGHVVGEPVDDSFSLGS
jgi:hypothetical protein